MGEQVQSKYFQLENTLERLLNDTNKNSGKNIFYNQPISFSRRDPDGNYLYTLHWPTGKQSHGIMIRKLGDTFELFNPNGKDCNHADKITINYSTTRDIVPLKNITPERNWNGGDGLCSVWCSLIVILYDSEYFDINDREVFYNFMNATLWDNENGDTESNGSRWIEWIQNTHSDKLNGDTVNTRRLIKFLQEQVDLMISCPDKWVINASNWGTLDSEEC
jgi:hypothetical protein